MRIMTIGMALAVVCALASSTCVAVTAADMTPIHAVRQPDYAKSGQAAVLAARQKYSADVVDYAFEGRHPAGGGQVEYQFRLWLRKDGREFGVRVVVKADAVSGEPVGMTWTEINP